jgi:hypothetical protein
VEASGKVVRDRAHPRGGATAFCGGGLRQGAVDSNWCRRLLGRRCSGEFELGDGMDGSAGGARGGPLHGEASECGISSARGGSAQPVSGRARQRCKKLSGARSLKRVNSGGAELWVPLGAVGGFAEKEWGERGRVLAQRWRIEEGKEKGRGFRLGGAWRKGVRPRRGARGEGGTGPGAAVPGGRCAHDASGRERERRGAGGWAAQGVGPSGREREKKRG